jgi:hypothetical protein
MARFINEHKIVDLSLIPLLPLLAKEVVIRDTEPGQQSRGYDRNSFEQAERQAWELLKNQR